MKDRLILWIIKWIPRFVQWIILGVAYLFIFACSLAIFLALERIG